MEDGELYACIYYYLKIKDTVKNGTVKGLRYKQAFDYCKMIKNTALCIERKQILDFDDLCGGIKIECSR